MMHRDGQLWTQSRSAIHEDTWGTGGIDPRILSRNQFNIENPPRNATEGLVYENRYSKKKKTTLGPK